MKIKNLNLLLLLSAFFLFSCSDENITPEMEFEYPEQVFEPTEDVVKKTFNKKVVILADNDANPILNYILKRTGNTTSVLDESAEMVIVSEQKAGDVLNDASSYEMLESIWYANKPIAFVYPAQNSLKLYCSLTGRNVESISDEVLENYKNLTLYVAKADGKQLMHEKFMTSYTSKFYAEYIDEDGQSTEVKTDSATIVKEFTPSDYNWGQIAENLCEWLGKNYSSNESRSPFFVSSSRAETQDITYDEITYRVCFVHDHDEVKRKDFGTQPPTKTVYPIIRVRVAAGYNTGYGCDVYDVQLEETFPTDSIFIVTDTKKVGKLRWKYTGGRFRILESRASLKMGKNSNFKLNTNSVEILNPVPMQSAGSYSETHTPGNWTIGAEVSAVKDRDLVFSATYTFPETSVTKVHSEFPATYTENNITSIWEYWKSYYAYEKRPLINAKELDIPNILKQRITLNQAVAFKVKDSKPIQNDEVYLNLYVDFGTFNEGCSPYYHMWETINKETTKDVLLPKVNRYFMDYSPYCYDTNALADSDAWSNFENMINDDANYKKFRDNLEIGGSTEEEMTKRARSVWEQTINSIIKEHQGKKVEYNFIVALADENGNCLDLGLSVDTLGNWVKVDNLKK